MRSHSQPGTTAAPYVGSKQRLCKQSTEMECWVQLRCSRTRAGVSLSADTIATLDSKHTAVGSPGYDKGWMSLSDPVKLDISVTAV